MTTHERATITIPTEVAEGGSASPGEVVREAPGDGARQRGGHDDPERLREAVRAGLDSGPALAADTFFSEWRARYAITDPSRT